MNPVGKAALEYPFAGVPPLGEAVEIVPGLLWIRMPLDMALNHVNLFAIADGAGWTLVDTGMKNERTASAWPRVLGGVLGGRPITRLIVTHMHPDHVGMAGWIVEQFGCSLSMTPPEYLTCRVFANDTSPAALHEGLAFYRAAGWDDAALDEYRASFHEFRHRVHAIPETYTRLGDKQRIRIGEHDWHVVTGYGHSPEHACLYCPALQIFMSGDQVLPKITSNVSVFPIEPAADPLAGWMASIAKLRAEIPANVLVLPAHNEPFYGLHARLDVLALGHERGLERLLDKLREPRRAVDVFDALFARPAMNDPMLLRFATGESLAHLNRLMLRGEATVEIDRGIAWYRRA